DLAHRGARASLRAEDPSGRRAGLPLPVRTRTPGALRKHLPGPPPPARGAPRPGDRRRMTATSATTEAALFERNDEPAYLMDPREGRILDANDAGCRMLGYTRAELLETPISRIHPAELAELSQLLERVLRDQR